MNLTCARRITRLLLWTAAVIVLGGCRSLPPPAPMNLSEPGWVVREGQAVWKQKPEAEGIAGDLLVAMHWDGRNFIQFTKPPLPLVVAQSTSNTWQAQFFAQKKTYSGRGRPPERILWLQLPRGLLSGAEESDWIFTRKREGAWNFRHDLTGESLEGFLKTTRLPPQHRIQPGEHILRVARRYGLMVDALRSANPGRDSEWFREGNVINLPAVTNLTPAADAPQP